MVKSDEELFKIAEYLGDLNDQGGIKGFCGNEKGYAKIIQICKGCSIWVHRELDDKLIINLLISPSAKENYPYECKVAVEDFYEIFSPNVNKSKWVHATDKNIEHDRYIFDVTDKSSADIISSIDEIHSYFL